MADATIQVYSRKSEDWLDVLLHENEDGTYSLSVAQGGVIANPGVVSGQKTVTTPGTAVALGSQALGCSIQIKALDTNAGIVAVGNDGSDDVTVDNGFRLNAGESIVLPYLADLADLYLDSVEAGDGICWIAGEVL